MKAERDYVELTGSIEPADIRRLKAHGHIPKLSVTKTNRLIARQTRAFSAIESASELWLWCDVTRVAMRHVLAIPKLKVLDVLSLVGRGELLDFSRASSLEVFRCNHYLAETDLHAISTSKTLVEVGVQGSALSLHALRALLLLPQLRRLDIEGTPFDDEMANLLSRSRQIDCLDVGATRLTGEGLTYLCGMHQLRQLDLWATRVEESDVGQLARLPQLEYLSLGNVQGVPGLTADVVLPVLRELPALKRLWLDGILLTERQIQELESQYESVRVT
jgi:hypothetical protein